MARFVTRTKLGGGQVPPADPPTIHNTLSDSALLPTQVAGADYLFTVREAAVIAREAAIVALEKA